MFITFEGTEGCGKSTLIQNLARLFTEKNISHVVTREPGGSTVAESIRQVILHQEMHSLTELFLYEAARAEHYQTVVAPALRAKKIVLCDRFTDSTVAYQGFARGLDLKMIAVLNKIATSGNKPQLTFFLDLPVELGLARAVDPNKFEKAGVEFQKKVRKGFLYAMKKEPKRWAALKVQNKTPEEVSALAMKMIEKVLAKRTKK
jgi:dTMP kinase